MGSVPTRGASDSVVGVREASLACFNTFLVAQNEYDSSWPEVWSDLSPEQANDPALYGRLAFWCVNTHESTRTNGTLSIGTIGKYVRGAAQEMAREKHLVGGALEKIDNNNSWLSAVVNNIKREAYQLAFDENTQVYFEPNPRGCQLVILWSLTLILLQTGRGRSAAHGPG